MQKLCCVRTRQHPLPVWSHKFVISSPTHFSTNSRPFLVGIVSGVRRCSVALDQRIWRPERLRSTGTELGGGVGDCGASVFVMRGRWECFVHFKNILFTKVDDICRQIDVCLPLTELGVGGVEPSSKWLDKGVCGCSCDV